MTINECFERNLHWRSSKLRYVHPKVYLSEEKRGREGERKGERGREGSGYNNMVLWCAVRSLIPRQRDEFDTKTDTLVFVFLD